MATAVLTSCAVTTTFPRQRLATPCFLSRTSMASLTTWWLVMMRRPDIMKPEPLLWRCPCIFHGCKKLGETPVTSIRITDSMWAAMAGVAAALAVSGGAVRRRLLASNTTPSLGSSPSEPSAAMSPRGAELGVPRLRGLL